MKNLRFVLCLVWLVPILFSCNSNDNTSEITEAQITGVYSKTAISFNAEFYKSSNIQLFDGVVYMCGSMNNNGEPQPVMAKMNLDDSSVQYDTLNIDASPNSLAVTENRYVYIVSNFDMNTFMQSYILYIANKDNNIISESPISDLIPLTDDMFTQISMTSTEDRIYVASGKMCIVLDEDGKKVDTYELPGNVSSMQADDSGNIYIFGYDANYNAITSVIDSETSKLNSDTTNADELKQLSGSTYYFGNGYDVYVKNETGIVGYNFGVNEQHTLINWVNSGMSASYVENIVPLDADNFIMYGRDVITNKSGLWRLERVPDDEIQQKTIIRVSYMEDGRNIIPLAAIKFNSTSTEYHIVCEEYSSTKSGGYDDLFSAYDADILTGNIGDILVIPPHMDYEKYAEKGVFYNIYDLIENDDTFSIDTLYECVKAPFEIDNKLYVMISEFYINTLVGKTKNLPSETWNTNTLLNFIQSLPDDVSLMQVMTRVNMSNMLLLAGAGEFIDFENGTCSFDSDEFISLLEYIGSFPDTFDNEIDFGDRTPFMNDEIYLYQSSFGSFAEYLALKVWFGFDEDITMIGYPSQNGGVTEITPTRYYAVTSSSGNKDGAWEFVKYLISGETVIDEMRGMRSIPSSRETFREWLESEQMMYYFFPDGSSGYRADTNPITEEDYGMPGTAVEMTDEIIEEFESFINEINLRVNVPSTITEIINEEINIYFSGNKTAEETADVIQSRVGIYLSEKR